MAAKDALPKLMSPEDFKSGAGQFQLEIEGLLYNVCAKRIKEADGTSNDVWDIVDVTRINPD